MRDDIIEKEVRGLLGTNPAVGLLAMAAVMDAKVKSMSEKDINDAIAKTQRDIELASQYRTLMKGKCINCEEKLVRGKRNKKNNYKRDWTCSSCSSVFYL